MGNFLRNIGLYLARPLVNDMGKQILALEETNYRLRLEVARLKRSVARLRKKNEND